MVEQRKANPRASRGEDKEKHDHPLAHLNSCRNRDATESRRGREGVSREKCDAGVQAALGPAWQYPPPPLEGRSNGLENPTPKEGLKVTRYPEEHS